MGQVGYDYWLAQMQPHIRRFQRKYANRVCSSSDIRQECMIKLWMIVDKIRLDMTQLQTFSFLIRCMENHLIDKTSKFISAEGHSRTTHKRIKEERPYQFADRGSHVDVAEISGQNALDTAEDIELRLSFLDELSKDCNEYEIEYIHGCIFNKGSAADVAKRANISRGRFDGMKSWIPQKIERIIMGAL